MDFRDEKEIISRFKAGKEDSFHWLYEKYVSALRYFAYRYISDREAVDDIIQDVFVDLWEKRSEFLSEASVKSYLYKGVKNDCLNLIRHQQVHEKYSRQKKLEDYSEFFLENVFRAEVFQMLLNVFNELPPACRQVYQMSLEGMKHEEIARKLSISVNTVKKHKNNANKFLQNRLKNIIVCFIWFVNRHKNVKILL